MYRMDNEIQIFCIVGRPKWRGGKTNVKRSGNFPWIVKAADKYRSITMQRRGRQAPLVVLHVLNRPESIVRLDESSVGPRTEEVLMLRSGQMLVRVDWSAVSQLVGLWISSFYR